MPYFMGSGLAFCLSSFLFQKKWPVPFFCPLFYSSFLDGVRTLTSLVSGSLSPKWIMGPVGIMAFSYAIVSEQPLVYYVYFLGLISATIAVINFLPLPPLDGGLIVLMLIEKIKGSALSERTQGIIAYTGLVLIGGLVLYVTFNDIVRVIFG